MSPSEPKAAKESARVKCKNCGEEVDPRRVELGYDYCTRRDCQERLVNRVELARVTVNKAADQYVRADEVAPDRRRVSWGIDEEEERDEESAGRPTRRVPEPPPPKPRMSTARSLQVAADKLDAELTRVYERFCRSEMTAAEMRAEQNGRIRAFNDRVRSENIRYRSFLRKTV
jgi:hypothetical protein